MTTKSILFFPAQKWFKLIGRFSTAVFTTFLKKVQKSKEEIKSTFCHMLKASKIKKQEWCQAFFVRYEGNSFCPKMAKLDFLP